MFFFKKPVKIQILDSQSQQIIVAFHSNKLVVPMAINGYKWYGREKVYHAWDFLGHNFVFDLRTLKPKKT